MCGEKAEKQGKLLWSLLFSSWDSYDVLECWTSRWKIAEALQ